MKYLDSNEVLRGSAGPSPWYLRAFPPVLEEFVWQDVGDGMFVLKNQRGEIVAIIDMYCYVLLTGVDRLLIWYQPYQESGRGDTIVFLTLYLKDLLPITDFQDAIAQIQDKKLNVFTTVDVEKYLLPAKVRAGIHQADFPPEIRELNELLILGHSTVDDESNKMNLCIFRLMPKKGEFEVIPQDWFNNGDLDFGYQWVTRVAREPKSGKIYGEGIRISSFVLDETNRQVEEWLPVE